ncbi:exo-beta-1,3-glucanase [Zavarzinia sp.]|uniref:glycoside hydrolase family 17 protein n=1 Tax=Zavarzinia sp. TaxID=2027920 RepID=UPI003BB4C220
MRSSRIPPLVVLVTALVLTFLGWWLPNRPVALDNPYDGLIESVSFAPFRGNQSPLTGNYPSSAEIAQALDALVGKVKGVRLYTAQEGMQEVPELAGARGLKVFAGAWLGMVPRTNKAEIASLIDLANRFPDTIDRVIVGNEVLLRKDLPVETLIEHIRTVRGAINQPVTYADVWEFWLKNPQLAAEVDFITIHILPYWEDNPLPVEAGNAHVDHILSEVKATFPDKPVVIGEIGWPTYGRDREAAVAGRLELARFITNFLHKAGAEGIHYNIIEAFDQPWKSAMEGTVGANWGLFGDDWRQKFDLKGPVVEMPQWPIGLAIAAALVLLTWARQRPRASHMNLGRALLAGAILGLATYAVSRAAIEAWYFAYMPGPRAWAVIKLLIGTGVAFSLVSASFRMLSGDARIAVGGWTAAAGDIILGLALGLAFLLSFLLEVSVTDDFLIPNLPPATITQLWPLLPVDGRYRDFPTVYLGITALVPVLVALIAALTGRDRFLDRLAFGRVFGSIGRTEKPGTGWFTALLCLGFLALAGGLIAVEGTLNTEAWIWAASLVLMSLPFGAATLRRWLI